MVDIINLSANIEDLEEYEPLPAGLYPAEIRDVEVKHSEKQPNGYFVIQMKVDPADFPADYDTANNPEGAVLTYARVQIPDPANRRTVAPFNNLLKAAGIKAAGRSFDPNELVGKQMQVLVSVQTYNGQLVNNVDSVAAIPAV